MLLLISDASLASEARDDLRDDAREPRWTCKKEDNLPCQPPPGLDDCVTSSASPSSRSFFRLQKFFSVLNGYSARSNEDLGSRRTNSLNCTIAENFPFYVNYIFAN